MKKLIVTTFFLFIFSGLALAQTSRAECFPFERLSAAQRTKAETLLLKALDTEGLYTIVGGIKPMSSGFANFNFSIRVPREEDKKAERAKTLADMEETRVILSHFRCGDDEIFADVQHFAKTFEGKRFSEAVVFNRRALRQMLAEKSDFFVRWGVTPGAHPLQVLYAVEPDETGARFGGYGYLFGYPDYAVRFFVQAADEEEFSGKFVERDFYSISTFENEKNRFVYAVPKGHKETEFDLNLKRNAEKILADYKTRRKKYVGDGKKGVVEMLRDWFCKDGKCAVSRVD